MKELKYLDEVIITSGFYEGCKGTVVDRVARKDIRGLFEGYEIRIRKTGKNGISIKTVVVQEDNVVLNEG